MEAFSNRLSLACRVQGETRSGTLRTCPDVDQALASKLRQITLNVGKPSCGYWIRVVGDSRAREVRLFVNGEPPDSIVEDIVAEIQRHCSPPASRWWRWPWRLWQWFAGHVWAGVVAGLIVTLLLVPLVYALMS
ncbi:MULTISPECIES: hypothetical protein [Nonomuraea]|uniref:Uncharacterized protein n=1 Tax=Nonomuraea ferruginea TaxID=46174 RepID=A0ABT4SPJ9_9ACTN|nr:MULTISPECIES: hypothetical protein [Nonomuraea]MDA0639167.1 hypothetical protein [Nonomuraea ferruginea]TXK35332.1 hypothetical protein FR742_39555 [Nonomuraea sp. C10]